MKGLKNGDHQQMENFSLHISEFVYAASATLLIP